MRVICIGYPNNRCRNSGRVVEVPKDFEVYTVLQTKKRDGLYFYILQEMPHDVGYESSYFIPLSNIDELELVNKKEEVV
jgi:hypothetical protein